MLDNINSEKELINSDCPIMMLKYTPNKFKRNWKPNVQWFYGNSNEEMLKHALELLPDAYIQNNVSSWDKYEWQENIIINGLKYNKHNYPFLLRVLDCYPLNVPTRKGCKNFVGKNIIIICAEHPEAYIKDINEIKEQLLRRIDIIKQF